MINKPCTKSVGFLSTYPPSECGLATFTEDLVRSLNVHPVMHTKVIAVLEHQDELLSDATDFSLFKHERSSYIQAAQWANASLDLLVIEHEYGIFGGECGEYILDLVKTLTIPFVITTHTVLLSPSLKQQLILSQAGNLSTNVITMAESSISILASTYGIDIKKIVFIPHGVPGITTQSRNQLKAIYSLQQKTVISSFGLISPAKGLEYGIKAISKLASDHPNLLYLILGKTHPSVKEINGESYRQQLINLSQRLGIKKNVHFIDKYLTKEEIMAYLGLSDAYLTPYLSKEQAVSGTLAYAMGCGRVIISTPYRYAQEMLGNGRGLLAKFKDAASIAACIQTLLEHPMQKKRMENKTLAIGKTMLWSNVAQKYADLFGNILKTTHRDSSEVAAINQSEMQVE